MRAMSASLKGGLFVGAAVAVGLLAAFLVPPVVVGRETGKASKADARPLPVMPHLTGRPLDEAEAELGRRGIAHVTDGGDIFGVVVPSVWEVCETVPGGGQKVRRTARLRAALPGTCAI
jgi:hypothetical protein